MPAPEAKQVKNRVHLDLTTVAEDRDAESSGWWRWGPPAPTWGRPSLVG